MKRYELIARLINENFYKTITEIGVKDGETTRHILSNCPTVEKYYAVDIKITDALRKVISEDKRICLWKVDSIEASQLFTKEGMKSDLVFIDADHSYSACLQDIKAWLPLVNTKGILCGHDYLNPAHRGVEKAVNEMFSKDEIEVYEDCYMWVVRK